MTQRQRRSPAHRPAYDGVPGEPAARAHPSLDQLDAAGRERVRRANLDYVWRSGVRAVEANVVYAIAEKPEWS